MVVTLPSKLEDWNITILDELVKYKDIESETFDFKGVKLNKLYLHICAMANTSGGFMVLGVDEVKSDDGKKLLGFKKIGFDDGEQDQLGLEIGNSVFKIEPNPLVTHANIADNNGKFYTVLKIEHEISKKPYFIKDTGSCYVRIKNSSRPASRTTVLNLFSNLIEKRASIQRLRASVESLKEGLLHTSDSFPSASHPYDEKATPVDLSFIKNDVISCAWFLAEQKLLGRHTERNSIEVGIYYMLHQIERLNTYIESFNAATMDIQKERLVGVFGSWRKGYGSVSQVTEFLDKLVKTIDEYLAKQQ